MELLSERPGVRAHADRYNMGMATSEAETPKASRPRPDRDLQEWLMGRLSCLARQMGPYLLGEPHSVKRLNEVTGGPVFSLPFAIRAVFEAAEVDLQHPRLPQSFHDAVREIRSTMAGTELTGTLLVKKLGAQFILGEEHQRCLLRAALPPSE